MLNHEEITGEPRTQAAQTAVSRHNRAMHSFISELKRRNVLRVAAAYGLIAWILIEPADTLLPLFGAPDSFFKVYVAMVLAGFVVAVIFAWIFEITPEGVKLERDIDRSDYAPPPRGGVNFVLIGLLVLALGVSLFFNLSNTFDDVENAAKADDLASVAVLPFENRSTDPENGFFADGIQDDLLNRLSEIDSLHVIARTSVVRYRGTEKSAPIIAKELGVTSIVRGMVQRAGDEVKVSVVLVDAVSDTEIWAESYQRNASIQSIFELQAEISREIASSLQATLTPADRARLATIPTQVDKAFELFVRGTVSLGQRGFDSLLVARKHFEEAIALDPNYAQAHAALAETVMLLSLNHLAINRIEARAIANGAVNSALRLDPENAAAFAVRGLIQSSVWERSRVGDGNVRAAESFRQALDLNSNLANAYVWFAYLRENENRVEEAIRLLATALAIDPLNRAPYVNLPVLYAVRGDNLASTELLLKALELFPDWESPMRILSIHLQKLGRLDESVAWSLEHSNVSSDPMAGSNMLGILRLLGEDERVAAFMDRFPADHPVVPIATGYQYFINEDYADTLAALEFLDSDLFGSNAIVYPLMARSAILLHDYHLARSILLRANPRLNGDEMDRVDRFSLPAAVLLAYVEQQLGNPAAAEDLLRQSLEVTGTLPRVGFWGYGIRDVQILTLQGQVSTALDRLRDAIDAGFVSAIPFDFWDIDTDPLIAALRDEPRYIELRAEMGEHTERMRQSIESAIANDGWAELRAKTRASLRVATR